MSAAYIYGFSCLYVIFVFKLQCKEWGFLLKKQFGDYGHLVIDHSAMLPYASSVPFTSTLGKASKHRMSCIVIYIQKQKTMIQQYQGGHVSSVLKLRVNFSLLLYDACIFFRLSEQKKLLILGVTLNFR